MLSSYLFCPPLSFSLDPSTPLSLSVFPPSHSLFSPLCSKYKVDCACVRGNPECPVLKHNLEPTENLEASSRRRGRKDKEPMMQRGDHLDLGQNQNMTLDCDGRAKGLGADGKQRKLSPLRLSISNNQVRFPWQHNSPQSMSPSHTLPPGPHHSLCDGLPHRSL